MPTILERVTKVTAAKLSAKEEAVTPTANFTDDLGADSLDQVELIMGLEEEFTTPGNPIKIPDEDAAKIKTVQDAVAYIKGKGITDSDSKPVAAAPSAVKPAPAAAAPKAATPKAAAPKTAAPKAAAPAAKPAPKTPKPK
jgi:acyl carrier protein